MNDLRDYGDKKTVVLHTTEQLIFRRVESWSECLKIVPYEQEQYSKRKVAIVGYDIYLPRNKRIIKRLERVCGRPLIGDFPKLKKVL